MKINNFSVRYPYRVFRVRSSALLFTLKMDSRSKWLIIRFLSLGYFCDRSKTPSWIS